MIFRILKNAKVYTQINDYSVFEAVKKIPYFQDVVKKCEGDCSKISKFVKVKSFSVQNEGVIVLVYKK